MVLFSKPKPQLGPVNRNFGWCVFSYNGDINFCKDGVFSVLGNAEFKVFLLKEKEKSSHSLPHLPLSLLFLPKIICLRYLLQSLPFFLVYR